MDEPTDSLSKKVISYLLPAVCGMIMGFIFFRGKIFQPHITLFQFVVVSIEASVLFNILKDTNLRNSIAAAFVIFIVNSFYTKSLFNWAYFLRDVLYILAIFFTVLFFYRIFYLAIKPYLYPLAFGLLFLFLHLTVDITLMIIYSVPEFWRLLYIQAAIAGLIGLGLGSGILIVDRLILILNKYEEDEDLDEENETGDE